jgi:dipeptidyl aminopeptidase/acylaminoacyl peptidase
MRLLTFGIAAAIAFGSSCVAQAQPSFASPQLADFAQLATIVNVQLNPSGSRMLIVRLAQDGQYEIEVRDVDDLSRPGRTFGAQPAEVRNASWLSDSRILVNLRERIEPSAGPGFWASFSAVFDDNGALVYRLPGAAPQLISTEGAAQGAIYLTYDSTGDGSPDVHRLDVDTGRDTRVLRGNNRRFGFEVDRDGEVRISATFDPDRFEVTYWARRKGSEDWAQIARISPSDRKTFTPVGFHTEDPNELAVIANFDKDTAGLHIIDVTTGNLVRTLFSHPDVDVEDALISTHGRLLGARYATDRPRIAWLDREYEVLSGKIEKGLPGRSVQISARTPAGLAVVRSFGPADPGSFYLLGPDEKLSLLGLSRPELQTRALAEVSFGQFAARDGVIIPYYLTAKPELAKPGPLVVMPHGGPWARDHGGWDEWAQMLAALGYAVVQPQFRGSTGFGRSHWLAGDGQWGRAMQDDLDDAVLHLVEAGIADPSRVAMLGWSYGGYAALTAGWRDNGIYRCTIAGAAVSDLSRINAGLSENPVLLRIQKPTIVGTSPLDHLARATIPVLVIHGDIDQIVPVSHGRDAAKRLKSGGRQYDYIEVKQLDHQLDRFSAEQKRFVYGAMAAFLANDCGMAPNPTG